MGPRNYLIETCNGKFYVHLYWQNQCHELSDPLELSIGGVTVVISSLTLSAFNRRVSSKNSELLNANSLSPAPTPGTSLGGGLRNFYPGWCDQRYYGVFNSYELKF